MHGKVSSVPDGFLFHNFLENTRVYLSDKAYLMSILLMNPLYFYKCPNRISRPVHVKKEIFTCGQRSGMVYFKDEI